MDNNIKHLTITIAIAILYLAQGCTNPNNKIPTIAAFKSSPLDSAFIKIRPNIQTFNIDNKKVNTVKAAGGTEVLIPANCFVDGNGNPVKENVQVEIVEAFSLEDFISSGLATVSGDNVLMSKGMMYINASTGDTKLQLSKGAALSVSMPVMNGDFGFQLFTGDGTNWTADSSMIESEYSIPLPLKLLYPRGNSFLWHCLSSYENGEDRWAYYDTTIISFTNARYENTVIATQEFKNRVWTLASMTEKMSYFINSDYYFDRADCFGEKYNLDLFKVYYNHPNRSFRESDSIAKKLYIDYFNANEKKMEDFCNKVNDHKRVYYSNWTDTNYYFDFRKISMKDDYMGVLQDFSRKSTKALKLINDRSVNLNAANAYDLLKEKGVDAKEVNEILTWHFQRQAMIKILQREKDAEDDKEKISEMYESTLFSVTKMGWINCDRFYDDPAAAKAAMYVNNTSGNELQFIDCSLVITDMNVRLSAFPDKVGSYAFTKKDGPYTKLPIGKSAVIIGVAFQNDSLFFASKKITIQDGLTIGLPMKYTNAKNLNDSLKTALN